MSCSLLYERDFGLGHTFASEHEDTVSFGAARAYLYPGGIWEGSVVLNVAARREGVVVEAIPSLGWDPVGWCRFSRSPPFDRLRVSFSMYVPSHVYRLAFHRWGILSRPSARIRFPSGLLVRPRTQEEFGRVRCPHRSYFLRRGSGEAIPSWDGTRSGWCRFWRSPPLDCLRPVVPSFCLYFPLLLGRLARCLRRASWPSSVKRTHLLLLALEALVRFCILRTTCCVPYLLHLSPIINSMNVFTTPIHILSKSVILAR